MRYTLSVLRALLQLSNSRIIATSRGIIEMTGGDVGTLRAALRALHAEGLVQRNGSSVQLTLAGLAVAVASRPRRTAAAAERPQALAA